MKTVKAREHRGAQSLNLTIPVDIVRNWDIHQGDIFEVEIDAKDLDKLVLKYKRVYVTKVEKR